MIDHNFILAAQYIHGFPQHLIIVLYLFFQYRVSIHRYSGLDRLSAYTGDFSLYEAELQQHEPTLRLVRHVSEKQQKVNSKE